MFCRCFEAMFSGELAQCKVECRYRHIQGHYVWFEMSMSRVSHDDGEEYVLVVGRDISERKIHEQQFELACLHGMHSQECLIVVI